MTRSLLTSLSVFALFLGAALSLGCRQAPANAASQGPAAIAVEGNQETQRTGIVLASTERPKQTTTGIEVEFDDTKALTKTFIAYNNAIVLTPEQERIKAEALSSIPAPCCSEFSLATCCCPCNLAKSAWGLAKHLITERGYGVDQVREAALRWVEAVSPNGFSGTVCKSGGCNRPFEANGCGGMNENHIL